MAYSASLAERIRQELRQRRGIAEKRMFGGLGFLLHGNLLVGAWNTALIVRVGRAAYEPALLRPHTREFDITGRPMPGWVLVAAEGLEENAELRRWIELALEFVATLPSK